MISRRLILSTALQAPVLQAMFDSFPTFWDLFFIFQMLLCIFGVFSQLMFMKTTVWDKKITFHCRVYLFFLSLGYQLIIGTFVTCTLICIFTIGSIFEVPECKETRVIALRLHHFGEFMVIAFHLLINLDRLMVSYRPTRSRGGAANVYLVTSCLASFAFGAFYVDLIRYNDFRRPLAVFIVTLLNVLIFFIEIKLFHYTNFVYKNTIGLVPLERRLDLSTSVSMVRCFLPASVCGLLLKFLNFFVYFTAAISDPSVFPSLYFVMNFMWNLECTLFPWFFILFHPSKMEKLKRFLRVDSSTTSPEHYYQKPTPQTQQEHFDQFRVAWKLDS